MLINYDVRVIAVSFENESTYPSHTYAVLKSIDDNHWIIETNQLDAIRLGDEFIVKTKLNKEPCLTFLKLKSKTKLNNDLIRLLAQPVNSSCEMFETGYIIPEFSTHTCSRLNLALDVPFWWDKDELEITYNDTVKPFIHHIQDMSKYVSIMAYRRTSEKTIELVKHEAKYAQQIGKSIYLGLETNKLSKDSHISFFGLPFSQFENARKELLQYSQQHSAVDGIQIHHFTSFLQYIENEYLSPPRNLEIFKEE